MYAQPSSTYATELQNMYFRAILRRLNMRCAHIICFCSGNSSNRSLIIATLEAATVYIQRIVNL